MRITRSRSIILAAAAFAAGVFATVAIGQQGPQAVRTLLGSAADPQGAKGRTLGLSRVVVPAGAKVPLHHHEGTQVAYITEGVLRYTVESGSVPVMRGTKRVRRISAGQTGDIRAGHWIVEQPNVVHRATTAGDKRVLIHHATLLRTGAPAATPDP